MAWDSYDDKYHLTRNGWVLGHNRPVDALESCVGEARGAHRAPSLRLWYEVAKILATSGYQLTAQRRLPDNLACQLRLATGQVVNIYDSGSLVVQGVDPEPVERLLKPLITARSTWDRCQSAHARDAPDLVSSTERPSARPARSSQETASWFTAQSWIDADGRPIPLPGTDAILARVPPPPPPKVWENPKTLRHMLNRLRALGYSVQSDRPLGGEWQIKLKTGQTIYYREGGEIRLGPFERDYRLERLFKMDGGY